jgi:hypothetical protein
MDYQAAVDIFFAEPPPDVPTPEVVSSASPARRLRDALEPIAMHAVWSPRTNAALAEHGFDFFPAYVCGRAAPLGEVPSAVVAATFAVFEPNVIDGMWRERARLGLPELIEIRDRETTASLRDVLSPVAGEAEVTRVAETLERVVDRLDGAGRTLFSALRAQPRLADSYGRLWRVTDLVREHRGDSHIAASIAADLDAVRMNILSELWLGYPLGEYSGTRAWPQKATDAALARLEADGYVVDGAITPDGRRFRDEIERATDVAQQPVVDALGGELDGLVKQLDAWSKVCVEAKTFPPDFRKRAAG